MNEPLPYYETPPGSPSRVRLYLGDCREIVPLVCPPGPKVVMLCDRPYGVKAKTSLRVNTTNNHGTLHSGNIKGRTYKPIHGDARPADPSDFAAYARRLEWGWNHFGDRLPPTSSLIVWDKREESGSDDGADGEVAWSSFGGPARIFRHLWRGVCRASETGVEHLHPTQKPEAFYRWLLQDGGGFRRRPGKPVARPGIDRLVSPFAGSCPEATVAIEMGFDLDAVDVEREYLDTIIAKRIEPALVKQRPLTILIAAPKPIKQLSLAW